MRRLNSRCTGQRPLSVQRIWPTIDAIEPSTLSTPHSSRSPRIACRYSGSRRISATISLSIWPARSVSSLYETLTLTAALPAPRLELVIVVTALKGTMCTEPSAARRRMVRIETFSTVPDRPETLTLSPTWTVFSSKRNSPVMRSCTSFCEPKPMAIPTIPAPASNGATLTPISLSRQTNHRDDQAQQRRSQHRLKGTQSRGAREVAVARQHIELAIHQRVASLQDRRRLKRGDADRHYRRQQPATDLAAVEPDDGIHTPDFKQCNEADESDDSRDDFAQ